jgi:hypothetical protein
MGVAVVQKRNNMPSQMMQHFMQEGHYLILGDVVSEEHAK